jgi:hypothetical protein
MLNKHLSYRHLGAIAIGICLIVLLLNPRINISPTLAQTSPNITQVNPNQVNQETTPKDSSSVSQENSETPDINPTKIEPTNPVLFNPPPLGAPRRTADAGARGECPIPRDNNDRLTLLIPENNLVNISSTTINEYPTILWYLPEYSLPKDAKNHGLVLRLANSADREINSTILNSLSSQPGIGRFTLSESQFSGLKTGEWYKLDLFMFSADNLLDEDNIKTNTENCDYVQAYIGRRPLNSHEQAELNAATNPEELWNFYAQEVIWYDALATLDLMRREHPEDEMIQRRWSALLGLIGLGELSAYPPIEIGESVQP